MSYYDFEYFWTHEEIGGQKLENFPEKKLFSIQRILKFIFARNDNIRQKYPEKNEVIEKAK